MLSLRPLGTVPSGWRGDDGRRAGVAAGGAILVYSGDRHVGLDAFTGSTLFRGEFSDANQLQQSQGQGQHNHNHHHHGRSIDSLTIAAFGSGNVATESAVQQQQQQQQSSTAAERPLSSQSQSQQVGTLAAATSLMSGPPCSLSCNVQGESGSLVVRLLDRGLHGALGVVHVDSGTCRDPLLLRAPPKKGGSGSVCCIAGSQLPGSGLIFLGRSGVSAVYVVRIDPGDAVGSMRQVLRPKATSSVQALACHPSRPLVAVATLRGDIQLWSYSELLDKSNPSTLSGPSLDRSGPLTDGGPTESTEKVAAEKSKRSDDKLVLHPRIAGALRPVASLSTEGSKLPPSTTFRCLCFHSTREWLAAGGQGGGVATVAVWNMSGERIEGGGADYGNEAFFDDDGEDELEEGVLDSSPSASFGTLPIISPFAARNFGNIDQSGEGASQLASTLGTIAVFFHPSEDIFANVSGPDADGRWWLAILNPISMNMCLPCVGSTPLPSCPSDTFCEPLTGRIFVNMQGIIHCLSLGAGLHMDRAANNMEGSQVTLPPSAFAAQDPDLSRSTTASSKANSDIGLPLTSYFLRSMSILVKAGPAGRPGLSAGPRLSRIDIPAMKTVLYSQNLEKDKAIKDRGRPRRLVTLPGHTHDVRSKAAAPPSSPIPSGHLRPYRLIPGPHVEGDKRRFLVLYEILQCEDFAIIPEVTRLEVANRPSRTVCTLITQPGWGEMETEANVSGLMPTLDGCFVSMGAAPNVVEAGAGARDSSYVLLLVEKSGFQVASYTLPNLKFLEKFEVTSPISRVFPTPVHFASKVLYVVRQGTSHPSTVPEENFTEFILYGKPDGFMCPLLHEQSAGGVAAAVSFLNPSSSALAYSSSPPTPHLRLRLRERVLDVSFQRLDEGDEEAWGHEGASMLCVLSTYRVLLLSCASLAVITQIDSSYINSPLPPVPISTAWMGAGVMVCFDDGVVKYLTKAGELLSVCSLNRSSCTGGIVLSSVLPDRLCYLVRAGKGGGAVHLMTKPIAPLEPLLRGILAGSNKDDLTVKRRIVLRQCGATASNFTSSCRQSDKKKRKISTVIATLVKRIVGLYSPPLTPPAGSSLGEGRGLHSGATRHAYRILMECGFHEEALQLGGIPLHSLDRSPLPAAAAFYRRRPWIAPLERCLAAVKCGSPLRAALEAIGDDPALVECVMDPDSLTSVGLPHASGRLAKLFRVLARVSASKELFQSSKVLLDASGDDWALAGLLSRLITTQKVGVEESPTAQASQVHLRTLGERTLDPLLAFAVSRSLGTTKSTATEQIPIPPAVILRRGTLLSAKNPLPEKQNSAYQDTADIASSIPPSAPGLCPLALHSLDEWIGRCRPECLEAGDTLGRSAIAAVTNFSSAPGGGGSLSPALAPDDQSHWVSVGGQWRPEDNVCGYWRFTGASDCGSSEIFLEELELRDLSKYGNVAAAKGKDLSFEVSTSPVDPGDPGKVSEPCDACFGRRTAATSTSHTSSSKQDEHERGSIYKSGIFAPCPRGSSLDIGVFHDDTKRSAMTLEFLARWERRDDAGYDREQQQPSYHILAARYATANWMEGKSQLEGEKLCASPHIWSLTVESDGALCFMPGPKSRREAGIKSSLRSAVVSPPETFPPNRWVHVACIVNSGKDQTLGDVLLYVDCEVVAEGSCRFSKVPRNAIAETVLAFGPELVGWRMTEVRLWAMLRDEAQLHDFRETYLTLAQTKVSRLVIRDIVSVDSKADTEATTVATGSKEVPLPMPPSGTSSTRRLVRSLPKPSAGGSRLLPAPLGGGEERVRSMGRIMSKPPKGGGGSGDARKAAIQALRDQESWKVDEKEKDDVDGGAVSAAAAPAAAAPAAPAAAETVNEEGGWADFG